MLWGGLFLNALRFRRGAFAFHIGCGARLTTVAELKRVVSA
jgi:hypothetical protein